MPTCESCGLESEVEFKFCPACGAKVGGSGAEDLIGSTLNGKYKVVRQIGQGAMGVVYEGEHVALQKRVALKVLHPDLDVTEDSLRRFQQEGIAAGRFTHPGAIQIFDFDREGTRILYLAMEFLDGEDLKSFLKRKGRLAPVEAVSVARQILSVLAEAHALGIVHRDLKPDNVMVLKQSAERLQVKVLDFGLSKLVDVPLGASMQTQVGRIMGTPLYMAPEQVAGEEVDHRADLYALGLILYELMAGLTPFPDQSTTEILFTRASREAPSIAESFPDLGIPPRLDAVLAKALQRRREDRYQGAEEMLADLEAIAEPDLTRSGSVTRSAVRTAPMLAVPAGGDAEEGRGRKRLLVAGVALVLLGPPLFWLAFLRGDGGAAGAGTDPDGGAASRRLADAEPDSLSERQRNYLDGVARASRAREEGNLDAALVYVNDAIALEVDDPAGLMLRARIHLDRLDLASARADVDLARTKTSGDPELEALSGWVHLNAGESQEAAAAFGVAEEAARASGSAALPSALVGRAALALEDGLLGDAGDLLEVALGVDDGSMLTHVYLGRLALAEDDAERALASFFRARSIDASDWRIDLGVAEAYALQGDSLKAERALRDARDRNAYALPVRRGLAANYVERELWTEARDELRDALDRFPDDGPLLVLRGVLLEADGDPTGAIDALEAGLEAGVEDAGTRALLGILHHRAGDTAAARDYYESARSRDDALAEPWLNLGLLALDDGDWRSALELFDGAILRDRGLALAHFARGVTQRDYAGDREGALDSFERYRSVGGDDPRVEDWIEELSR